MQHENETGAGIEKVTMGEGKARRGFGRVEAIWMAGFAIGGLAIALSVTGTQVPTTVLDFKMGGTQPGSLTQPLFSVVTCSNCHAYYDEVKEPFAPWAASMMGQSARDPIFHAALAIANQDAAFAGELCLRCHSPQGWLGGRSSDPTGGALIDTDFEGVSCSACHRMVDPEYEIGVSPLEDEAILAGLPLPPGPYPHDGNYVMDPLDRRRGPYDLTFQPHQWLRSAFHRESQMCATCHEVANPVFMKQPDGTFGVTALNQPHPTNNTYDMLGEQRTYTEWLLSDFAQGPVEMNGRFGGNITAVSSCQDCHMPKTVGTGCDPNFEPPIRSDLPQHHFLGANTWVLRAVRSLYDDSATNLSEESVEASLARTKTNLENASDLEVSFRNGVLKTRVINQTGHRLPTGYPEGRQMWINVRFLDDFYNVVQEIGAYDPETATLDHNGTKIYKGSMGVDSVISGITGVAEGPSFHLALNNVFYFDNRIPPRGFTNEAFANAGIPPIGYSYADGQYWDDTEFVAPAGATQAQVSVFYQTTIKEYIEWLRDENVTNDAGDIAYAQWELHGKSEPALMDYAEIVLVEPCIGDFDQDGGVTGSDIGAFFAAFEAGDESADVDFNGGVDGGDLAAFFAAYEAGC